MLVTFQTIPAPPSAAAPVRYAARQVLDQEYEKNILVRENAARQARYRAGNPHEDLDFSLPNGKENLEVLEKSSDPKKDFFGRVVEENLLPLQERDTNAGPRKKGKGGKDDKKVWVSYHEGFSNAVRKPITIEELMRGL